MTKAKLIAYILTAVSVLSYAAIQTGIGADVVTAVCGPNAAPVVKVPEVTIEAGDAGL